MQLYHHPFSLDSQKVRLALEEKGVDYTSYHMNPITGKSLNPSFFRMNPTAKLPVFKNGSHIIFDTIDIIQYIERIAMVSSCAATTNISDSSEEILQWMKKIQGWDPKFFTLSYIPEKHRLLVSKFRRQVLISRMADSPDLASSYHRKLKETYEIEEKVQDPEVTNRSKEELLRILDEAEERLSKTPYLGGEEFSMADVVFIPVLARIALLSLEDELINGKRPNVAEYWAVVRERPSYKKVIGRYFSGWRKYRTLIKTWCFVRIRTLLNKY